MAQPTNDQITSLLTQNFSNAVFNAQVVQGQLQVDVDGKHIFKIIEFLKNDAQCDFQYLVDVGGLDYLKMNDQPKWAERFCIVYILQNMNNYLRMVIRAHVSEEHPEIDSISSLFLAAEWPEREVFDLYGITFKNNKDLRRILMPDDYEGYPLRKDYPLQGRGEREAFPRYEYYDPSKKQRA